MARSFPVIYETPQGEFTIDVSEDQFLWQAAGRAGIDLPSRCRIGWCLTCAARLEGPGEVDQSAARRYFEEDRQAGFILPCTAQPRSALRMKTHQQEGMRQHRQALGLPAPI
ncbi:MAG: 2Fe-2S iron-sulfur cluster-binding protein [Terriglobales bacterium]